MEFAFYVLEVAKKCLIILLCCIPIFMLLKRNEIKKQIEKEKAEKAKVEKERKLRLEYLETQIEVNKSIIQNSKNKAN